MLVLQSLDYYLNVQISDKNINLEKYSLNSKCSEKCELT